MLKIKTSLPVLLARLYNGHFQEVGNRTGSPHTMPYFVDDNKPSERTNTLEFKDLAIGTYILHLYLPYHFDGQLYEMPVLSNYYFAIRKKTDVLELEFSPHVVLK